MMEAKIFETPCSPATESPEYLHNTNPHHLLAFDHPIKHFNNFNQDIESAFSALALSPDNRSQGPRSFQGVPSTVAAAPPIESFRSSAQLGENQHSSYRPMVQSSDASALFLGRQTAASSSSHCFPGQNNDAIVDGSFAFQWAHNVGPDGIWVTGSNPYLHVDDRDRLMNVHQRQDFDYSAILHGKEQISRNTIPILPFAQQQQGNFGPSLYSNPQFYKWHPESSSAEINRGRIVSSAKDQNSMLNLAMEEGLSEQQIDLILPGVLECSSDLLRNQIGSQFVLKLFSACDEYQREMILFSLISYPSNFVNLCLNTYGARAIQKLLEKLSTPQQIFFMVSSLVPCAFTLSTDPNGQHVIQQCVKKFSSEYVKKLIFEIASKCYQIGTNKSGCCVIQSCVENSSGEPRKRLINKIIEKAIHLAEDPYGNYVVQHLLGMKFPEATAELMRQFRGHFVSLSCNKFASNVVEKFLVASGDQYPNMIIMEFLQNAPMLFLDPYGNFVIQKALSVSKGPIFYALEKLIRENAASMQSNIYGKKILEWFQKNKDNHA